MNWFCVDLKPSAAMSNTHSRIWKVMGPLWLWGREHRSAAPCIDWGEFQPVLPTLAPGLLSQVQRGKSQAQSNSHSSACLTSIAIETAVFGMPQLPALHLQTELRTRGGEAAKALPSTAQIHHGAPFAFRDFPAMSALLLKHSVLLLRKIVKKMKKHTCNS